MIATNNNLKIQDKKNVIEAYQRIASYLHKTPVIQSDSLNFFAGHEIYFKIESLQKTGAFKVRGALNHLLILKEQNKLPDKIVCYSTGNHGIGLAWAAKQLNIKVRIYLPKYTAKIKQQAAEFYGAEVIYTENRKIAEQKAYNDIQAGYYYMHPSDNDDIIAGAGTLCYEAIQQLEFEPDAIFAPCGGGGLLSGSYLAKELLAPQAKLFGAEPKNANDAYLSLQNNEIFKFTDSPETIADGLKTLAITPRIFDYLKKLDGFYEIAEKDIYYWTTWLFHILKVACEPSCALTMQAAKLWLKQQSSKKKILILISGGNIDPLLYKEISKDNYLLNPPNFK